MDDLGKDRCIHRSALKHQIQKDCLAPASTDPPVLGEEMPSVEVSSEDVDLLMLAPETSPVCWGPVPQVPVSQGPFPSQSRQAGVEKWVTVSGVLGVPDFVSCTPSVQDSLMEGWSCTDGSPLWRTGRATVDHHSNPHCGELAGG